MHLNDHQRSTEIIKDHNEIRSSKIIIFRFESDGRESREGGVNVIVQKSNVFLQQFKYEFVTP